MFRQISNPGSIPDLHAAVEGSVDVCLDAYYLSHSKQCEMKI